MYACIEFYKLATKPKHHLPFECINMRPNTLIVVPGATGNTDRLQFHNKKAFRCFLCLTDDAQLTCIMLNHSVVFAEQGLQMFTLVGKFGSALGCKATSLSSSTLTVPSILHSCWSSRTHISFSR